MLSLRLLTMATGLVLLVSGLVRADDPPGFAHDRNGTASCSARGCHGQVAPPGTLYSEFHTWATLDPHRSAADVLLLKRSSDMQRLLKANSEAKDDALCQSCHGKVDSDMPPGNLGGVTCTACHGTDQGWGDVHFHESWTKQTPAQQAAAGFQPLRTERELAGKCMSCHVGSGLDQQVNHDLIAAGHPRLNFELASYLDRLPRHWNAASTNEDRAMRGIPARTPARIWAVGQVEAMKGAVDLLAARAEGAERQPPAPWPEFTEFGCFSCHHSLHDLGPRYQVSGTRPGSLPWNSWMTPGVHSLAKSGRKEQVESLLGQLQGRMAGIAPQTSDIVGTSRLFSTELEKWATQLDGEEPKAARELLAAYFTHLNQDRDSAARVTANWDAAAQLLLAMGAAVRDLAEPPANGVDLKALEQFEVERQSVLRLLQFPEPVAEAGQTPDASANSESNPTRSDSPGAQGEPAPTPEDPASSEAARSLLSRLRALIAAAPDLFKTQQPTAPAQSPAPKQ